MSLAEVMMADSLWGYHQQDGAASGRESPLISSDVSSDVSSDIPSDISSDVPSDVSSDVSQSHALQDAVSKVCCAAALSDQARAELQAIELEGDAHFRMLAEALPHLVWTARPDGYNDYFNQRWREYTGLSPDELFYGDGWQLVFHPDDLPETIRRWHHSLQTGDTYEMEYRCRRYDGAWRWFLGRAYPVRNKEGKILRWFGTCTDIDNQKKAAVQEQERRQAAERSGALLDALFQAVPAGLALVDEQLRYVRINPLLADLNGVPVENHLGKTIPEILPHLADKLVPALKQVLATGQTAFIEITGLPHATHPPRTWLCNLSAVRTPDTKIVGIGVVVLNITERKNSEQAREAWLATLERSNKALDEFAHVASHDLKAPLRGIANLSQWLQEDWGPYASAETRTHLELLRGCVHRMEALIDGILNYSRAGGFHQEAETVDVYSLLTDVLALLNVAPPAQVDIQADLPTLCTARVPLQQVFTNLIGNALKYAQRSDVHVQVRCQEQAHVYSFSVQDNGPGIPLAWQDRIWALFHRLEGHTRIEGAGIGLAVVKKIVEEHGGRVCVESSPGHGARFQFTWPKNESPHPKHASDKDHG